MTDWHYWAVDVPGMTQEQAAATVRWLNEEYGLNGTPIDPHVWMSISMDVSTVRALADATARYPSDNEVAAGLREDCEEWLGATQPEDRA